MPNAGGIVGLGLGIAGSVGQLFGNAKANKELKALEGQDPTYQSSPYAAQRFGLAQTLLNSRMPGTAQLENDIYGNQSNTVENANRVATNSAQALAVGAGAQGQTNQAFDNLNQEQNQYFQNNLNNYNQANAGMINEGDKVFQDKTRRFEDTAQIQGAINANRQNTWGSIANGGFALADFGMNGGFSNLFGSKKGSGLNNYTTTVGNIPNQGIGIPNMYGG